MTVVNTDPQRRCYDGVNFSERIDFGEWTLFGTYDTSEAAHRTARIFACSRWQYRTEGKLYG